MVCASGVNGTFGTLTLKRGCVVLVRGRVSFNVNRFPFYKAVVCY